MGNVSHISCPACSGAVGVTNINRVLSCSYCKARLFVDNHEFIPEYRFLPTLSKEDARRKLQQFLGSKYLPEGMLKKSRLHSSALCYVPFYEFRTRRLGRIETTVEVQKSSIRNSVMGEAQSIFSDVWTEKGKKTSSRQTQVVINDIERLEPAVTLDDYGLKKAGIYSFLKKEKGSFLVFPVSFSRRDKNVGARIIPPSISPDLFLKQLEQKGFCSMVDDETQYVETSIRCIYYPVWRLKYKLNGLLYSVIIDGITGEMLFARAPLNDSFRVLLMLSIIGIVGLLTGVMLKNTTFIPVVKKTFLASDNILNPLVVFICILLLIAFLALFTFIWFQFRYKGELIVEGESIKVERYNSFLKAKSRGPLVTPRYVLETLFFKGH